MGFDFRIGKRTGVFSTACFLVCAGMAATAFSETIQDDKEEKEAMQVGGLLTVDRDNSLDDWGDAPVHLSRVELSANVNVNRNAVGSITLLSDDDPNSIVIYQALGQLTINQAKLLFGRQAFNFGLFSTRLISSPSIFEMGEVRADGVNALWTHGIMTVGAGASSLASGTDSNVYNEPCFVLNGDLTPHGQMLRLSFQLSPERQGADAAGNLAFGPVLLDLEGMWRWEDDDGVAKGGYAAGLAWQANDLIQLAVRWDGLGDKDDPLKDQRIGGGITLSFLEHVFGAVEVSNGKEEGARFAMQMGLQSTLALPGFRSKTLANPEN